MMMLHFLSRPGYYSYFLKPTILNRLSKSYGITEKPYACEPVVYFQRKL